MSRSKRVPIIKDRPRNHKKSSSYWRKVRRVINERVKEILKDPEKTEIPDPKSIVNDYDYCDYTIDFRERNDDYKDKIKAKRK
jgi:hypothetical protein